MPTINQLVSLAFQKFDPEKSAMLSEFYSNNAMCNGVLRIVPFKIHFLTCFSSDQIKISIANTNIDALYAGSLRIIIAYFFSE